MKKCYEFPIAVMPGDGIGPELIEYTKLCLNAVGAKAGVRFLFIDCAVGLSAYKSHGTALPKETLDIMQTFPVTLMGAISSKECPPPSPMGQMRKALGFYADIRHCASHPYDKEANIDAVVVRECSEGFLSDRNMYAGTGEYMPTPDVVLSTRVITREKSDMIAQTAFDYAKRNGYKRITIGHKKVVFALGCGLFRETALNIGKDYSDIFVDEENVDGLAGNLVSKPEDYEVILTTNLFGDILSDVLAARTGGSIPVINTNGTNALFYPLHGAMIEYAGKDIVNPRTMLRTASAMLNWLDLKDASYYLDKAVDLSLDSDLAKTLILPEGTSTKELIKKIIKNINDMDLV